MQLSKSFQLEEFLISKQHPELLKDIHILDQYKWNLYKLCAIHLQNLRDFLKLPITITSGYRTPALNKAIGGAQYSQHMFGEAADFQIITDDKVNQDAMHDALSFIKSTLWPAVGDCIDYHDAKTGHFLWIHISLPEPRCVQRFSSQYKNVGGLI